MKYISFSVETTGADPLKCDILECGLIVEDTKNQLGYEESPKIRFWVDKEYYKGSPFALVAQSEILKKICDLRGENSKRLIKPDEVCDKIINFLKPYFADGINFKVPVLVASFNYTNTGRRFLSKLKGFDNLPLNNNTIEVHSQFIDWNSDNTVPSFGKCREIVGLKGPVLHDTLQSSWDVIQILRTKYPQPVSVNESIS